MTLKSLETIGNSVEQPKIEKLTNSVDTPEIVKDETKDKLGEFYSETSLDNIGVDISEAKKLAKSVGITSKKELREFQKNHGLKDDEILGRDTFLEIKALIINKKLTKNFDKNISNPEFQEEILFILEKLNSKSLKIGQNNWELIGKMRSLIDNNQKKGLKYYEFSQKLSQVLNKKLKPLEDNSNNGQKSNGISILGKGGVTDVVRGKITWEEMWNNNKEGIKSAGILLFVFAIIFGKPEKVFKNMPLMGDWYTRIPLLIGLTAMGGGELISAGIEEVTKEFKKGTTSKQAVDNLTPKIGQTTTETKIQISSVNSKVDLENKELGAKKLEQSKIYILQSKLYKNEKFKNTNLNSTNITIAGLGLIDEFKNTGIENKDLVKYLNLLRKQAKSDDKVFGDLFKVENKEGYNKDKDLTNKKRTISSLIAYYNANPSKNILGNGPANESGEILIENKLYKEFNEKLLKKYNNPKLKLILALSQIWIDGARKAINEDWGLLGLSNDKNIIQTGINGVKSDLNEIFKVLKDKDKNIKDIDKYINSIYKKIDFVESNGENILDDIGETRYLLNTVNANNYELKLAQLLKLTSGGFKDGNTEKSKEIAKEIIMNKYFKDVKNKIQNLNDFDSINSSFFINLGLKKEVSEELIEELQDTYSEVKSETEKHREIIKENYLKQNPNFNGNLTEKIDKLIKQVAVIQTKKMAEMKFVESSIENKNGEIVNVFKELNSKTQAIKEWLADNGLAIALSLIPMGVGFAFVGAMAKGTSYVMRGKTLMDSGRTVQFVGNSLKGVTFYEGMNFTNNALHQSEFSMNLLNGSLDSKELVKNALFFNIMGIATKLVPAGTKFISPQLLKSITTEIAMFTGVDLGIELAYGEKLTLEQFLNSLATGGVMSIMSRGAGKIPKIGSSVRGVEFANAEKIYVHKVNGKTYIEKADGKIYNDKGKDVTKSIKKSNLEKIKKDKTLEKNNNGFNIGGKLKGKVKDGFNSGYNSILNKFKTSTDFLKDLTYRGFKGEPKITHKGVSWILSIGGTVYTSREQIRDIIMSFNDPSKDIVSFQNGKNLGIIMSELWIFKSLGLIRATVYNGIISEIEKYIDKL